MLRGLLAFWNRLETVIIGLLMVAALLLFLYGSVIRAISPANAIDWAEEVTAYLIIWATLLSGSILAFEQRHIAVEVFIVALPPGVRVVLSHLMFALTFAFCGIMAFIGIQAVNFTLMLDERSASTLQVPQAWAVHLAMPVGMTLICIRMLVMLAMGRTSVTTSELSSMDAPTLPDGKDR
jgi:TRAP-type C4-dicarboxylate transport system permease small subunit